MALDFTHSKLSTVYEGGASVEDANIAVISLHGRGGNAEAAFKRTAFAANGTDDVIYFAPKSADLNWFWGEYTSADDPNLISSIDAISAMIKTINDAGIATENIILIGYSQGAQLANEYLAQTGANFKEVLAFSGSLVTPIGEVEGTPEILKYANADPYGDVTFDPLPSEFDNTDLTGQTITLTVHETDGKAPLAAMRATADYYRSKGAQVEIHVEPGRSHAYTSYDTDQLRDSIRFDLDNFSFVQTDLNNGGYVSAVGKISRSDDSDSRIAIKVFNEYGFTELTREFEVDSANGTFISPTLATLSNGNFLLVYADDNLDRLLGNIYDENGSIVKDNILLARDIYSYYTPIITLDGEGFDVQYVEENGNISTTSRNINGKSIDVAGPVDSVLPITGMSGNDNLAGTLEDDVLFGGAGNDNLTGKEGNDILHGQEGNDNLRGLAGSDILIGGTGADTFIFPSASHSPSGSGHDKIMAGDGAVAFEGAGDAAGDRINVKTIDANTTLVGNQAFEFGSTAKGGLSLVDVGGNTLVRGNIDNSAAFEFEVLIVDGAVNASDYSAADFIL